MGTGTAEPALLANRALVEIQNRNSPNSGQGAAELISIHKSPPRAVATDGHGHG